MTSFEQEQAEAEAAAEAERKRRANPGPDLATVRAQAREQAKREGHAAGLETGKQEGYTAGHAQGLAEGHASGHAAGYQEGLAAAREQGADEARHLHQVAENFVTAINGLEENMGQDLVSLALDIARQVLRTQLSAEPESLIASVREVLHMHPGANGPLRLWLHPQDLELVRLHLGDELTDANWRVLADESITRGGCRAQTPHGEIDGSLETRWRRVAASLSRDSDWGDTA
jgi:flagellar assembly protein FliH